MHERTARWPSRPCLLPLPAAPPAAWEPLRAPGRRSDVQKIPLGGLGAAPAGGICSGPRKADQAVLRTPPRCRHPSQLPGSHTACSRSSAPSPSALPAVTTVPSFPLPPRNATHDPGGLSSGGGGSGGSWGSPATSHRAQPPKAGCRPTGRAESISSHSIPLLTSCSSLPTDHSPKHPAAVVLGCTHQKVRIVPIHTAGVPSPPPPLPPTPEGGHPHPKCGLP